MPRGDGTGPRGLGSMTGRAAGICAGFGGPGYANAFPGRGRSFGRGRGFWGRGPGYGAGWGRWSSLPASEIPGRRPAGWPDELIRSVDPDEEKRILKNQLEALDIEMSAIRQRLSEMEKTSAPESGAVT